MAVRELVRKVLVVSFVASLVAATFATLIASAT
jgi:hypothetical protein